MGNRLCGRQILPAFNSTERKLKVRLRTDSSVQGEGFKVSLRFNMFFYVPYINDNFFSLRPIGRVFVAVFIPKNSVKLFLQIIQWNI